MHAFCSFPSGLPDRLINGVVCFLSKIVFVMVRCAEREAMEDGVGDLFDHIEDLLDFPADDEVVGMVEPCGDWSGPLMIPPLPESLANELLGGHGGGKDSLEGFIDQNQKSVDEKNSTEEDEQSPCDELDIVQLEWMSKFLEDSDSFSLGLPSGSDAIDKSTVDSGDSHGPKADELCFFRTSSPVSVLEAISNAAGGEGSSNSSSSFSSSTSESYFIKSTKEARAPPLSPRPPEQPAAPFVPARARSKRARPTAFSPRPHVIPCILVPVPGQVSPCAATSDPESFGESFPAPPPMKKKQKKKIPASNSDRTDSSPPVRKCTHCEIQKTPQWRAGPLGPKTLCNACGVRYKSGRLFPEYRPAASPTFVPSIHSNSHKKVIEMRITATHKAASAGTTVRSSDSCDLLAYIRRRE
ncbi:hypothetical protein ZIOFF_069610 [Zingiber officinale]|uniref:GATA-type domain-containing protein n=2 Tax=Zingiber officinale TaxID=94328 RepID=A0A8J5C432_ZINOF|nr:hypothetical protein ZIOFF_069610 [Zingiber officinale]